MGKLYRSCCKTIFFFKALVSVILGSFCLGIQVYLVILKHNTTPKPLPPIGLPPIGSPEAVKCFYNDRSGRARLEPPEGSFFFGFSPEWVNGQLPKDVANSLGYNPPLYNTFVTLSRQSFQPEIIEWNCQLVAEVGGVLELTLMPDIRADEIPDTFYPTFAQFLRRMNSKYGVPILLRFMHEMNGYWMTFGYQPTAYIASFRRLSAAVRQQTNLTALIWSPNVAAAYPPNFRQGSIPPGQGTPTSFQDFTALDTNRDGVLTTQDDPYTPYYPGDDVVDWIGISTYNYERTPDGQVRVPTNDALIRPDSPGSLFVPAYPFYSTFVTQKRKPFILSETGASIDNNIPGNATILATPPTTDLELSIKQAWWKGLFANSVQATPGTAISSLKAAVWFEISKPEETFAVGRSVVLQRDFRITHNKVVRDAFIKDVNELGPLLTRPGKFQFSCDGTFNLV